MEHCLILLEHEQGKVTPASYELVSASKELAGLKSIRPSAVILGSGVDSLAEEFARSTGLQTIAISLPEACPPLGTAVKSALNELFAEVPFQYLIACHSTYSMNILPALAVQLTAACIPSVEGISQSQGQLYFRRSVCGGKLTTQTLNHSNQTLLTIQAGSFGLPAMEEPHEPMIISRHYNGGEEKATFLGTRESTTADSALKEARVIVAAGRGIETEDNLDMIREFASFFKRSAIAGSRPLCDIGWLDYNQQVGITGATVSPDLYVACGISGMFQHIIGMRESGCIVAINKDNKSPFFQIADICVVEDVASFISLVIEECQKRN